MAVSLYSSGSTDALLAAKLSDAPIDGSTYGRLDGAWAVVAGGGGLTVNDLSNGATSTLNATVPTTGQALTYDGTDLKWATLGGAAVIDIQTWSTPGTFTWTKPAGAKLVVVYIWGAGGGGGAGARNGAAGSAARGGGAGGAGGSFLKFIVQAADLSGTESVVVGAGSTGGPAQTTNGTAGLAGQTIGNFTSFGTLFRAAYGTSGGGGSLTTTVGGAASSLLNLEGLCSFTTSINTGGNGNVTTGGVANFSYPYFMASSGGGGGAGQGGGITAATAGGSGGIKTGVFNAGQAGRTNTIAGGTGGTVGGVAPTAGTAGSFLNGGGTGGGGGAYRLGVAGMAGAAGGSFGGGGGGGSASDNGFPSGAGGQGGAGAVIAITYF